MRMVWIIAIVILIAGSALSAVLKRIPSLDARGRALIGGASYLVVGLLVSLGMVLWAPTSAFAAASVKVLIVTAACSTLGGLVAAGGIWLVTMLYRAS